MNKSTIKFLKENNLTDDEVAYISKILSQEQFAEIRSGIELAIKQVCDNSKYFIDRVSKCELKNNFKFAKIMVTKVNPNTISAFDKRMYLPTKEEFESKNVEVVEKKLERRRFFADFFMNKCDLNGMVKKSRVLDSGVLIKYKDDNGNWIDEREIFKEKFASVRGFDRKVGRESNVLHY